MVANAVKYVRCNGLLDCRLRCQVGGSRPGAICICLRVLATAPLSLAHQRAMYIVPLSRPRTTRSPFYTAGSSLRSRAHLRPSDTPPFCRAELLNRQRRNGRARSVTGFFSRCIRGINPSSEQFLSLSLSIQTGRIQILFLYLFCVFL